MATPHVMASPAAQTLASKLRDYYTLTKPEVNLLILMTTSAGYYLASRGPCSNRRLAEHSPRHFAGGQRNRNSESMDGARWDGQMRRTASRPLPSGRPIAAAKPSSSAFCSASLADSTCFGPSIFWPRRWRSRLCSHIFSSIPRSSARLRSARCWARSRAPCRP